MKLVNLTPHDLHIHCPEGVLTVPRSGICARVGVESGRELGTVIAYSYDDDTFTIPTQAHMTFGEVIDLPPPQPDTVYLVSLLVAQAVKDSRNDVYSPDSGYGAVRNEEGQMVGTTRIIRSY